jgi:hypothetical protein
MYIYIYMCVCDERTTVGECHRIHSDNRIGKQKK